MQLRRKFLLVFVLVMMTIAGVLAFTFDSQRSAAVSDAQTNVEERAGLIAATVDSQLEEKQQTIAIAADNPELANHGTQEQQRALERLRLQTHFEGVSVVDANGTMVAIESENTEADVVGEDYSNREYVTRALEGELYVSEPLTAETGNRIVVVSGPIYQNGEIVGTVNGAFHLADGEFIQSIDDLYDNDTAVSITSERYEIYASDEQFETDVVATERVETTGWIVTVGREETAVTEPLRNLALAQGIAGTVLFGVVIAFGLWIYRNEIRQAEKLRDRFRTIEQRRYDDTVDLSGSTEWNEIDDAVDRLASTLARREQMLLVLNRLLRHNLRNSLNVIIGRADALAERTSGEERQFVDSIRSTCEDLLELSDRARKTEELLTREYDAESFPVDAARVVRNQVALFEDRHPDATVAIETPKRAVIDADSEFVTVVEELLENTADHAGPAPTVDIALRNASDVVELVITDDGPGIPPEERDVITGDREISHLYHTGGLGLWLVDWIVTRYGGSVEIERNGGTSVIVRVPAAEEAASAVPAESDADDGTPTEF